MARFSGGAATDVCLPRRVELELARGLRPIFKGFGAIPPDRRIGEPEEFQPIGLTWWLAFGEIRENCSFLGFAQTRVLISGLLAADSR